MKTFLLELERELERQNQELARVEQAALSIDPKLTLVFDADALAFLDEPLPRVSRRLPRGVRV
jgi:hypothetical protein